ncbi:hypothetical protein NSQ61_03100 [Aeribacillus sp. FSL K6-1121]|uniref:hypothetical protein n=1 Tax=Aeribacillus sp. FSL K6-1121 TaxID=2954745 RepID=UPI0030F8C4C1
MARREIGTSWDRENRNNINENFKELYDVQDRAIEEATQAVIDSAKLIWLEPVNTFTDITTTYPNPEVGHTVFVRDTGKVYRFYNDIWGEIQQIDAGPVNEIDTRLSAEIDENKQEIEQARTKADGTTFPVLRDRLNDVDDKIGILSNLISQDNLVSKDNIPADHLKENIDFGVSKFGIYFDGINASVTTIRDLTLKTNTTYILSVKANANGKRIRFQSYPDGVFVSPNYMISGETNIEYEFQTNDTVVTQIKVVQVDNLSGEEIVLTDIVLREKKRGTYTKGAYDKALSVINAISLSKPNRIFDGRSNSIYNAFSSGVRFQGKEYYVFRQGAGHHTPSDPTKWGKLVLLEREPNTLNFKVVDEIIETDYEPRDPNLSVSKDGLKMFLSFAATADEVNYNNYYYVYEWNMVRSSRITISEGDNVFSWGNMIQTPNGYLLKAGYTTQNSGLTPVYQSVLYRSNSNNPNNPQGFTRITIASIGGEECTETTLGYWRNYLIAMIRNKVGFSLVLTQDLEGQTGWGTPQRHTTLTLHAPCLMQYNKSDEDLYFTASYYKSASDRKPVFGCIRKPNKFMNAIRATQIKTVVLDEKTGTGGYTTLVPLSDSKFGVMYYRDEQGWTGASLFFMEVDKNILTKLDTDYYDKNIWNNKGSVTNFCSDALSYEFAFIDVIDIPTNSTEYDFTYTYKESATYDILYAEGFVVNRPNIEIIPKLPGKDYCIFTLKSKDGSYIPTAVTVRLKITKQMST